MSWEKTHRHYLNTAAYGLPPTEAVAATTGWVAQWREGAVPYSEWLPATDEARALFAAFIGVEAARVATGTSVAQLVGLVAGSLPKGSLVLAADDEFPSLLNPFLAQHDRGVRVETMPRDRLAAAAEHTGDVVAFSLVRSSDGTRAADGALVAAVQARGALTVVDAAQAVGWLDADYAQFDVLVVPAFKWLCSPRGSAFLAVRPEHLEWLRPSVAGWWPTTGPDGLSGSGSSGSGLYSSGLRLPDTAKRLDGTPVWTSWPGTAAALRVLSDIGVEAIGSRVVALANRLRDGLGLPPADTPIVIAGPPGDAARVEAAGVVASATSAGTRMSVHIYNDESDIDAALEALHA